MKSRLDDIESSQRSDSIIMSGDALPPATADENPVSIAEDIMKNKLKVEVSGAVVTAQRIGKKPLTQSPDRRKMLVRLQNAYLKDDILRSCRTVKPPQLYLNENLIQSRAKLLYALRQAKKRSPDKLLSYWSRDGRVYALLKSASSQTSNIRVHISDMRRLEEVCEQSLGFQLTEMLKD